jgi:hypothetical protein
MGQREFVDQPLQRARLFERIQILTLDVFDQGHRDGRLVRDAADDRRDFGEARHLRSAPTPLAGNDLVVLRPAHSWRGCCAGRGNVDRTHDNGLNDTLGFDRIRQLLQRLGSHVHAGLVFPALQEIKR